jgi:16S rRNA (uracil1498-N3)-methyltransferase
MTERVFWCETIAIGEQTLDESESRHAQASLRLSEGDAVTLLDGRGSVGHAVVLPANPVRKRDVAVRVQIDRIEMIQRPARRFTLIVAACKGERMDWLVEKCTELGVDRLWIATFERSVANPSDGRLERFERLARQASKQCRRAWMPELRSELGIDSATREWRKQYNGRLLVAHHDRAAPSLGAALLATDRSQAEVAVVVGPEGGISDAELGSLVESGGTAVTLANLVLRVESAALAAAAVWADSLCG